MWYAPLFEQLATTICKSNSDSAVAFINRLIHLVHIYLFKEKEIEPLFVLGVIKDLFDYSEALKDKEVSLEDFACKSTGLVVIHAKYSSEYEVYCSDFIDILRDKTISSALKINDDLVVLKQDYYNGKYNDVTILPATKVKTVNEFVLSRVNYFFVVGRFILDKLKLMERQCLIDLHYHVGVDFTYSLSVLSVLLLRQHNPHDVLKHLYTSLVPFKKKDVRFEPLIVFIERQMQSIDRVLSTEISSSFFRPPALTSQTKEEDKQPCVKHLTSI
ncbi:hypothetical protein [Legionella worsleiensis]|uniref:Uncharacterized protein n=1 Tax=Legionella worsleiensis TaxID=45076 RepID=A0A0W1A6N3_9GAMM|nr:hypothetical protein [Legionella worsleiensis]KTD76966.1 hypothetical protein Lwor_2191 [Legionella worsleiensis]STY33362.1 Uncharacterised protein [Legionella worsleiensis]